MASESPFIATRERKHSRAQMEQRMQEKFQRWKASQQFDMLQALRTMMRPDAEWHQVCRTGRQPTTRVSKHRFVDTGGSGRPRIPAIQAAKEVGGLFGSSGD